MLRSCQRCHVVLLGASTGVGRFSSEQPPALLIFPLYCCFHVIWSSLPCISVPICSLLRAALFGEHPLASCLLRAWCKQPSLLNGTSRFYCIPIYLMQGLSKCRNTKLPWSLLTTVQRLFLLAPGKQLDVPKLGPAQGWGRLLSVTLGVRVL